MLPLHMARSSSSRSMFFSCGVIDLSAFSRPAAGVQTCASVWSGSVAWGLTWRNIRESEDSEADSGVFYFSGPPSTFLFLAGLTLARPPSYTFGKKIAPVCPSGALAQLCGDCADKEILVAATTHDPNLFHN